MAQPSYEIRARDGALYNQDLAPLPPSARKWGAFEIFNVWNNDIQSLFGYTLAASLFISYGLNGWLTFAAIVVAGFIVMLLVNLTGRPSVRYGIPYPVIARYRAALGGFQSEAQRFKQTGFRRPCQALTGTPRPGIGSRDICAV